MKPMFTFSLFLRIMVAAILIQTLYFKFTGSPESLYIFETIGMEPRGRIGSGIVELIAAVLLLLRRTVWLGALLGTGTMAGAIFFHLTSLGIEVQGDGGLLFILATIVFVASLFLLWKERKNIPLVGQYL